MPQLPRVVADRSPQGAPLSTGAAMLPGEAAAGFGNAVADVGTQMAEKQIQLQRLNDFTAHSTDASVAIDQAIRDEMDNPDFRSAPDRINTAIQKITNQTLSNVRDPQVKAQLQNTLDKQRANEHINALDFQRKKEIDYGQSVFDASLETSRTTLSRSTGLEHDQEIAHVKGLSDAAVSVGLFSSEQMHQRMDNFYKGVTEDKARIDGIVDPAGTAKELVGGEAYNALNPSDRLQLAKQIISEDEQRKREKEQQLKRAQDSDFTNASQLADKGQLTLKNLDDLKAKWDAVGTPIPPEKYEHYFDLINKPEKESSSSPEALSAAKIAVNSTSPPSLAKLHDLYTRGLLNLSDYTAQTVDLEKNVKVLEDKNRTISNEYRSQVEKVIADEFGGSPEIHASALRDVIAGSSLKQIEDKYQAVYKGATTNDFKSSQRSYESAIQAQHDWDSGIHPIKHIGENPKDELVQKKTEEFINSAKKAGKLLGAAPAGAIDGLQKNKKTGELVYYVGGQVIAQ